MRYAKRAPHCMRSLTQMEFDGVDVYEMGYIKVHKYLNCRIIIIGRMKNAAKN